MIEYMAHETGIGMVTRNAIWGSDSNTFAWNGVPAMTLNRDGFGMHTRHDIVDYISPWSLERSARLLGHIAESLGNIPVIPFKRRLQYLCLERRTGYDLEPRRLRDAYPPRYRGLYLPLVPGAERKASGT